MIMNIKIRKANVKDIGIIFNFIKKLADFEKSPKEVTTNPDLIKKKYFKKTQIFFHLLP